MKKLLLTLAIATAALQMTACNTVQGLGKDIEKGGEAIQRAVK